MSLDDLLPLLLVAFFVVNAFLRGGRSRRNKKGGTGTGAPPAGRASGTERAGDASAPRSAPSTGGSTTASTASSPSGGGGRSLEDDLASRLEEARRRVQQARGEGTSRTASAQTSSAQTASSRPSSPSTSSQASQPASTGGSFAPGPASRGGTPASGASGPTKLFGGRERRTPGSAARGRQAPASGFLGREGPPPRRAKRPDASVAKKRDPAGGSARLPAAVGIGLDPDDIARGMVWSEILSPPVAVRRWRRHASRRPSR